MAKNKSDLQYLISDIEPLNNINENITKVNESVNTHENFDKSKHDEQSTIENALENISTYIIMFNTERTNQNNWEKKISKLQKQQEEIIKEDEKYAVPDLQKLQYLKKLKKEEEEYKAKIITSSEGTNQLFIGNPGVNSEVRGKIQSTKESVEILMSYIDQDKGGVKDDLVKIDEILKSIEEQLVYRKNQETKIKELIKNVDKEIEAKDTEIRKIRGNLGSALEKRNKYNDIDSKIKLLNKEKEALPASSIYTDEDSKKKSRELNKKIIKAQAKLNRVGNIQTINAEIITIRRNIVEATSAKEELANGNVNGDTAGKIYYQKTLLKDMQESINSLEMQKKLISEKKAKTEKSLENLEKANEKLNKSRNKLIKKEVRVEGIERKINTENISRKTNDAKREVLNKNNDKLDEKYLQYDTGKKLTFFRKAQRSFMKEMDSHRYSVFNGKTYDRYQILPDNFGAKPIRNTLKVVGTLLNIGLNGVGVASKYTFKGLAIGMNYVGNVSEFLFDKCSEKARNAEGIGPNIGWKALTVLTSPLKAVGMVFHASSKGFEAIGQFVREGCALLGTACKLVTHLTANSLLDNVGELKNALLKTSAAAIGIATSVVKEIGKQLKETGNGLDMPLVTETLRLTGSAMQALSLIADGVSQGVSKIFQGQFSEAAKVFASGVGSAAVTLGKEVAGTLTGVRYRAPKDIVQKKELLPGSLEHEVTQQRSVEAKSIEIGGISSKERLERAIKGTEDGKTMQQSIDLFKTKLDTQNILKKKKFAEEEDMKRGNSKKHTPGK
jgi:hypothetical protein